MHCSWCKNRLSSLLRWIVKILCSERWTIDHQNVVVNGEQANNISSLSHSLTLLSARFGLVIPKILGPIVTIVLIFMKTGGHQSAQIFSTVRPVSIAACTLSTTHRFFRKTPHTFKPHHPLSYDPRSSNQLHHPLSKLHTRKTPTPVLQNGLREWLLHDAPSVLEPPGRFVVHCDGKDSKPQFRISRWQTSRISLMLCEPLRSCLFQRLCVCVSLFVRAFLSHF